METFPIPIACWWAWPSSPSVSPVHGKIQMTHLPVKRARTKKPEAAQSRFDAGPRQARYVLRLYVNDATPKSRLAVENIKRVCETHLDGRYDLEVIDIHRQAKLARDEQIVAVPTLIKRLPAPLQRLVGDMSDLKKVLFGLDLRVREA